MQVNGSDLIVEDRIIDGENAVANIQSPRFDGQLK